MSNQGGSGPSTRGARRRRAVIDLNTVPREAQDQEETSREQFASAAPPTIDVDAIDDDVVESSPRAFAEAKTKSRSNRERSVMVDLDSGCARARNTRSKRRRISPNQPVIDIDLDCINEKKTVPNTPPPREEPTFSCPICMSPFTEETSTKCGHIFCKECIVTAIAQQAKCPTCRKKVTKKELIRIFLPASGLPCKCVETFYRSGS